MRSERSGRLDRALFVHDNKLRRLEEQLFGHVLAAIDFDRLGQLETSLFGVLADAGMAEDHALDVSAQLVDRALVRMIDDEARRMDFGPPHGITEAERRAVAYDEGCPICVEDRQVAEQRERDGPPVGDEPCPCCDDLARQWRVEHAQTLARAGLSRAVAKG